MLLSPRISAARPRRHDWRALAVVALALSPLAALRAAPAAAPAGPLMASFQRDAVPVLDQYCYDCHGYGSKKGGVKLDDFADDAALRDPALWMRAMKNVRAHIMPPKGKPQLGPAEVDTLMTWIKRRAFALDPDRPDPGRVTVRRLNRVEYRNTVRDLLGVDYDTAKEFPADDTGSGFDNIGDVLTISPMLLEKYLDAAQVVVKDAVPTHARVVAETALPGRDFSPVVLPAASRAAPEAKDGLAHPAPAVEGDAIDLSYYSTSSVAAEPRVAFSGHYQLVVDLKAVEHYVDDQFDYNRCRVTLKSDGEPLVTQEFIREGDKDFQFVFDRKWKAGPHRLELDVEPLGEAKAQPRLLRIRLLRMTVRGPMDEKHWVQPANYARFFPHPAPRRKDERRAYAREILGAFAQRAYRHPVDPATVDRLVALAERVYTEPDTSFESGIAQAMVAVVASPQFIFREEDPEPLQAGQAYPYVDEYALASRLSYFLWSSMPDQELFQLAATGRLRAQLPTQIDRMLRDPKSEEFVRNFTGQWLEARDIPTVPINALDIFLRDHPQPDVEQAREDFRRLSAIPEEQRTDEDKAAFARARKVFFAFFRQPKPQLTDSLREAMQRETELTFDYVLRQDHSLVELLESNYTFLNEELAKHYDIPGVTGSEMRRVELPADSFRGGILTEGTVLAVTSNPTRTSPVKRGVFILDKILGTPPAPPPPNIPPLEAAAGDGHVKLSLRESLAMHAKNKLCISCHSRMDPLGLALENFNAMGQFRTAEFDRPVEPGGKLITGESFDDIRGLKHILATTHRRDFYYCVSEKLLTYAVGRGLDYRDTDTIDSLVATLEANDGKPSALIRAIIASAPFQQRRPDPSAGLAATASTASSALAQTP